MIAKKISQLSLLLIISVSLLFLYGCNSHESTGNGIVDSKAQVTENPIVTEGAKDNTHSPGSVFVRNGNLYLYNENTAEIKLVYASPALGSVIGLSPDKSKFAFTSYATNEKAIGVLNMSKGTIFYIPAQYDTDTACWLNDKIIMTEGHYNPSANAFACYDVETGVLLNAAVGGQAISASDGSFLLFRITPHWTDDPPPDNIERMDSSGVMVSLYTVQDKKDKIIFEKLSHDDKKLFFLEFLNDGNLKLNWYKFSDSGFHPSIKRIVPISKNHYITSFVSNNLNQAYIVYGQDKSLQIHLYETDIEKEFENTSDFTLRSNFSKTITMDLEEIDGIKYLIRAADTGKINDRTGHRIIVIEIYQLQDKLSLIYESEEMDSANYIRTIKNNLISPIDLERLKRFQKAAQEFFQYTDECTLDEMGISDTDWFYE